MTTQCRACGEYFPRHESDCPEAEGLSDELPLPEQPRARAGDPVTSHEAGRRKRKFPWKLLLTACQLGVFTDTLLAEKLQQERNIVARRRLDLEDVGLVRRVHDQQGRPVRAVASNGSSVLVFEITDEGKAKMYDHLKKQGLV